MGKSTRVFAALMLAMAMVCFAGCFGCKHTKTNDEETATVIGIHEYVDLGLPSGTLWATCNVGAYDPNGRGYHLVWKDTKKLHKKYGWEKGWRTPRDTEWVELCKNTNCSWTTQNGVTGMLCRASNGKSIFLPCEKSNSSGKYWSSSPYPQNSKYAISFWFYVQDDSKGVEKLYSEINYENRKAKRTVRPVYSK